MNQAVESSDRAAALADLTEQMDALVRTEQTASEIRHRILKLKNEVFRPGTSITIVDPDGSAHEPGVVIDASLQACYDTVIVSSLLRKKPESWNFSLKEIAVGFAARRREDQP